MPPNFKFRKLLLWSVALEGFPVAAYALYDLHYPLPTPLNTCSFSFWPRFYIRRALEWTWLSPKNTQFILDNLQYARDQVLNDPRLGGAISPQATLLLVQMAQVVAEDAKSPIPKIASALDSLIQKPHIGTFCLFIFLLLCM